MKVVQALLAVLNVLINTIGVVHQLAKNVSFRIVIYAHLVELFVRQDQGIYQDALQILN